jgi:hypothetical protein
MSEVTLYPESIYQIRVQERYSHRLATKRMKHSAKVVFELVLDRQVCWCLIFFMTNRTALSTLNGQNDFNYA